MANKKGASSQPAQENAENNAAHGSSLIICRNKHWRYISSFHGPWLQLPPEILESLAHQNYVMPEPRLIDPSVFYDIVKIRRAVDEATEDAVRASSGFSASAASNPLGRLDPFGVGGSVGSKMSKERIFKVRQKAVRLLAKAYTVDEVAASVVTMQSTSTLEEVAMHVLKRDKADVDAKYVHFFHEKIPSRKMEFFTPLEPLTEIITSLPWEKQGAPLRTRALVQTFKGEYEGAINDLTLGLRIAQELKMRHKPGADQLVLAKHFKEEQERWNRSNRDWRQVPQLKEEDQPSSLEQQMFFNRAGAYLTVACQHIHAALDGLKDYQKKAQSSTNEDTKGDAPSISPEEKQAHHCRLEARKKVKTYAKRALKDYLAFLDHFDYTPGLPSEVTDEILRRIFDSSNGDNQPATRTKMLELIGQALSQDEDSANDAIIKHEKSTQRSDPEFDSHDNGWSRPLAPPRIYPASTLFAPTPPPDLPKFPDGGASAWSPTNGFQMGTREAMTYHPLLTDALHSVLLAHALLQTSPTELLRHAHNAARLARIADGYPIFQAARSPARADWIEVLRRANNWIGLASSWQQLCQPAPPSGQADTDSRSATMGNEYDGQGTVNLRRQPAETEEQKRERRKQEAILEALADERVVDEESFQRAVRARERRAMEDEEGGDLVREHFKSVADGPTVENEPPNGASGKSPTPKRWAQDEGKEYLITTERVEAIARWIQEAPLSMGGVRKKRHAKRKPKATNGVYAVTETMQSVQINDDRDEEEVD